MSNVINRLEALKDLVSDIVDAGADSVEAIHKAIADLPLEVLEKRGLLDEAGPESRRAVDQTIGSIYDTIRDVNKEVTSMAGDILARVAETADKLAEAKHSQTPHA